MITSIGIWWGLFFYTLDSHWIWWIELVLIPRLQIWQYWSTMFHSISLRYLGVYDKFVPFHPFSFSSLLTWIFILLWDSNLSGSKPYQNRKCFREWFCFSSSVNKSNLNNRWWKMESLVWSGWFLSLVSIFSSILNI